MLEVRTIEGSGGRGGKALQVYVPSLPPDLREKFLATLKTDHEFVHPSTPALPAPEFAVPYGRVFNFCDPSVEACNADGFNESRKFTPPQGYAVDEATLDRYRQIQHFADTAGLSFVDAAIVLGREGR